MVVTTGSAQAFDIHYYDDSAPTCDLSNCGANIRMHSSELSSVQKSGNNLAAYFKNQTGNQLTIYDGNFCPLNPSSEDDIQAGDYFDSHPIADGTAVTKFTVDGQVLFGKKYDFGDPNCNALIPINLGSLPYDASIGLYYAVITVDPIDLQPGAWDGIQNAYAMQETGPAAYNYKMAQRGGSTGYEVTVNESTGPPNIDYIIRFGSDCSVGPGNTIRKNLSYYDIDNDGGGGAQQNGQIQISLRDETIGADVLLTDNDTGQTGYLLTPPTNHNAVGSTSFLPEKDHKYSWTLHNVYISNTIQMGTPFDGIFFERTCAPVKLSCGAMTVNPPDPEPGTTVKIIANVKVDNGQTPTGATATMHIDGPAGFKSDPALSLNPTPGNLELTANNVNLGSAGPYTVSWTAVILGQTQTCPGGFTPDRTFDALSRPYVEVNAGDVITGSSFSTPSLTNPSGYNVCGTAQAPHNDKAGISSWNKNLNPYSGAGGEYAAMAMGYIQEFATSQGNTATRPDALAFANTSSVAPASGQFGGLFGTVASCVDYWGSKPTDDKLQPLAVTGGVIDLGSLNDNKPYRYDGTAPLKIGHSIIANGTHLTIYADSSVVIQADGAGDGIVYENNSWGEISEIPSVKLIVHGNIHIDAGVRRLDGLYVAVPDANYTTVTSSYKAPKPGTISTCSKDTTVYNPMEIATNNMANMCNKVLTVNGSLVANQIWLLRLYGSRNTSGPAEVINYSPEVWLAPSDGSTYDTNYKRIVGLPPIL